MEGLPKKAISLALLTLAPLVACVAPAEPGARHDDLALEARSGAAPSYAGSSSLAITTTGGDPADLYFPRDSAGHTLHELGASLPVVVLLQGAQTDKGAYRSFAGLVARRGFVVVVPNHARAFPPGAPPSLFTEQSVITDGFASALREADDPTSPVAGAVDPTSLAVVGHSFGGVAAILGVAGTCTPPFCTPGTYVRPPALKAAVVYGTNYTAGDPRVAIPVDTSAAPIAMLQGTRDGRSLPEWGALTYAELEAPKALIEVEGANHFGITDTSAPAGAVPDPSAASIPQEEAVAHIARSTAQFLRASLLLDPLARTELQAELLTR